MTRINSAISVENLTDEHLLAEHREIKRIPDYFLKALKSGALNRIPKDFCLGTGHVTFFLDKQLFCLIRYNQIHNECSRRGFKVEYYAENWLKLENLMRKHNCWNDYMPTGEERKLLQSRICERINTSAKPNFHYHGKIMTKNVAVQLTYAVNQAGGHGEAFHELMERRGLLVYNSIKHASIDLAKDMELQTGDRILYVNDHGVVFGPHKILGFCRPEPNGRCVYFDHVSYWFPAKLNQIIKL